jgi:hypothetical protein
MDDFLLLSVLDCPSHLAQVLIILLEVMLG